MPCGVSSIAHSTLLHRQHASLASPLLLLPLGCTGVPAPRPTRRCMCAQARRREVREGMERQFKESMAAPDWELEDYDW